MLEKIQKNLIEAQKAKDELKVSTLRLLLGAIKNFAIAKESASYNPSDEEILGVIQKEIKQRKESIESYKAGGRQELADKESKELEILQGYLPEQMGEEEIRKLVDSAVAETSASSMQDMGKVMGVLSPKLKGKADMGLVSGVVKEKLS
ncbi:MAG: hypothetical protein A2172_02205 [Candidatus Woykebacteria bacterium RBG_13_40_15]|uniref:Glutamyl-tRNA amidotransferase n=1 Tax=Candidatus Woykebacteria bacterium RBG_13_40_15 TaxID=1802593 RepID=A0A1G1W683_9BACT|nr:MAG: hypothetical protein A2172_02205 [Candidatus Woykebacteria bacterium RBG_13_40_15]